MPPRGSEGLDFTPILTHYLFLFTTILAVIGWFLAFIAQAIATAQHGNGNVGVLWFSIFVQLFLILGVLHTLATDSIAMHRFQISVFGAVAIVFAVIGVNQGIFSGFASLNAMAAGWLILAIVDILWVLYFTSEEDSLALHIFNALGTGGLTSPSRRRRMTRTTSMHNIGPGNGYQAGYATTPSGGIMPGYDTKMSGSLGGPIGGGNSYNAGSMEGATRSVVGTGSIHNVPVTGGPGSIGAVDHNATANTPLMGSGAAGVGAAGGGSGQGSPDPVDNPISPDMYRAKALYAYTASVDDPNEISFSKGETLEILDKQGKWWQAKKSDGTVGIAPSNYLQVI
ncbi:High osmolarity signaling protein [Sparassis crispa]|uniref:High osmolarity signaling protein n=1 Tax=Sparassis crispa TaxID=139825 RepID=A0A401G639_9APHY|nr:High osmolarity signaling protein [Sparassis crispa]GBE77631.1 High osmolarity signaling protein [Sparassis crispa]